jgi:hypothetical protein
MIRSNILKVSKLIKSKKSIFFDLSIALKYSDNYNLINQKKLILINGLFFYLKHQKKLIKGGGQYEERFKKECDKGRRNHFNE